MPGSLLTSAETARMLGKSPRTINRLAASGQLPYEQKLPGLRGSYLFSRAVVDMYLRQKMARAAS